MAPLGFGSGSRLSYRTAVRASSIAPRLKVLIEVFRPSRRMKP
jgi:hypothetical protein